MKFTTRDWLWLTVVIGLVLAWWSDRRLVIYRYDNYIRAKYNFKHMHTPNFGTLFEPYSEDPTDHRFHTKDGYDPYAAP